MFCKNCGQQLSDDAKWCSSCGTPVDGNAQPMQNQPNYQNQPTTHNVPKCTNCGHVGAMQPGPLFRKNDLLWIVLLMFAFGGGLIYAAYIALTRWDPNKREKICPNCGSVNLYTMLY